jgi:hypothetical protein
MEIEGSCISEAAQTTGVSFLIVMDKRLQNFCAFMILLKNAFTEGSILVGICTDNTIALAAFLSLLSSIFYSPNFLPATSTQSLTAISFIWMTNWATHRLSITGFAGKTKAPEPGRSLGLVSLGARVRLTSWRKPEYDTGSRRPSRAGSPCWPECWQRRQ